MDLARKYGMASGIKGKRIKREIDGMMSDIKTLIRFFSISPIKRIELIGRGPPTLISCAVRREVGRKWFHSSL